MPSPNYNYDKRRFETFIDAIIAIILTILILELRVPETEHSLSTQQQVASLLPSFISYIGSFLLIAGIWIDHHILFLNLQKLKAIHFVEHVFYPAAFHCTFHNCFCRKPSQRRICSIIAFHKLLLNEPFFRKSLLVCKQKGVTDDGILER